MYYQFPKDPKKIKAKIRSYERKLRKEEEEHGSISDGAGKRLVVSSLYLLIDDLEGALKSFNWYDTNFKDHIVEPIQYICWSLALFKSGLKNDAKNKLIDTMFCNVYLVPHLLGKLKIPQNEDYYFDWEDKEYIYHLPEEYKDLWFNDKDALEWLKKIYYDDKIQNALKEYTIIKENGDMSEAWKFQQELVKKLKREI